MVDYINEKGDHKDAKVRAEHLLEILENMEDIYADTKDEIDILDEVCSVYDTVDDEK
jgi:hypothetical protein